MMIFLRLMLALWGVLPMIIKTRYMAEFNVGYNGSENFCSR